MPFVDLPIECTVCRGTGRTSPATIFQANRNFMSTDCLNCRGKGTIANRVFINPEIPETKKPEPVVEIPVIETPVIEEIVKEVPFKEEEIEKNQKEISELYTPETEISEQEFDAVIEEVKKVNKGKKSRKLDWEDAR